MALGLRSNKTKDISVIGIKVKKEDKTRKVQACGTFSVERLTDQERQGENCARSNDGRNQKVTAPTQRMIVGTTQTI